VNHELSAVLLALIAALPAIIAAISSLKNGRKIKTIDVSTAKIDANARAAVYTAQQLRSDVRDVKEAVKNGGK
jgi:hypothetical protein